ncbi:MAG: type III pantothenate kinase [Ignavibacteria bacterium]|nr:type III pantothenate kinase [Ignavibacteria bacterium]
MNMNLVIDIGNSFVHLGVFKGSKLIKQRAVHNKDASAIRASLNRYLKSCSPERIGIASVNPKTERLVVSMLPKRLRDDALTINNKSKLPVKIKVKNSRTLGADRICNAVYGFIKSAGCSSLVIDLGTANTYDLVLKDGSFVGGIIAPGLMTSALALSSNTAKLPIISGIRAQKRIPLVGTNTKEAISSGLFYYMLFASEGIVTALKKQYDNKIQVFLTGGNAALIAKRVNFKCKVVHNTVLDGINMIINHNKHEDNH